MNSDNPIRVRHRRCRPPVHETPIGRLCGVVSIRAEHDAVSSFSRLSHHRINARIETPMEKSILASSSARERRKVLVPAL